MDKETKILTTKEFLIQMQSEMATKSDFHRLCMRFEELLKEIKIARKKDQELNTRLERLETWAVKASKKLEIKL